MADLNLEGNWPCHVCGRNRPDSRISVVSGEIEVGGAVVTRNVRYCNDRPECQTRAEEMCQEPFNE